MSEILVAWLLKDLPYIPYNLNTEKKKKILILKWVGAVEEGKACFSQDKT